MLQSFERTRLWQRTLAECENDLVSRERAALRHAYLQFRETVEPLAGEISQSMPMFTDHSINHIDALWDVASIICGDDVELNPAESFVLGGSFLMHDIGMGLVAYPGGIDELRKDPSFEDTYLTIISRLEKEEEKIDDALKEQAQEEALVAILRSRHAKRAERLIGELFQLPNRQGFYLLQDAQLRQAYGPLIGSIAHSHWWDADQLPIKFGQIRGSLADYPAEWQVDPLKIACILRLADAAHIDSRRAPTFLHAFRNPVGPSREHWDFQQRLMRPRRVGDRLEYTSTDHFTSEQAGAWWLAYETIKMIDNELRRVDALCADIGRTRFAARSVAGADSPARFAKYVPTDEWEPIDASLRVSNVPSLVATLGGRALYGSENIAPLRELIANAADATRARQIMHGGSDAVVNVILQQDDAEGESFTLEVRDQGIGMDSGTLVAALTDFGRSFWQSGDMVAQYPGLLAKGYRSTGRFGIGFYAVFMAAEDVTVRSLKYFDPPDQTYVLEFRKGLQARPVLRNAELDEQLRFGGTVISAKLKKNPLDVEEGILWDYELGDLEKTLTVSEVLRLRIARLCALADVDIAVQGPADASPVRVVRANDWKFLSNTELYDRLHPSEFEQVHRMGSSRERTRSLFATYAQPILDSSGETIGRAMVDADPMDVSTDLMHNYYVRYSGASVYVGGFEANNLRGLVGVMTGEPIRADRSEAYPYANHTDLARWIGTQRELIALCNEKSLGSLPAASVARYFNDPADHLSCGTLQIGSLALANMEEWASNLDQIVLADSTAAMVFGQDDGKCKIVSYWNGQEIELPNNVLLTEQYIESYVPIQPRFDYSSDPDSTILFQWMEGQHWYFYSKWAVMSTPRYIFKAISKAWGVPIAEVLNNAHTRGYGATGEAEFELRTKSGDIGGRARALVINRPQGARCERFEVEDAFGTIRAT
ncbi:hypothetical protein [Actinoplanes sp. NPDC051494]|uniref:HD domain-containing protein n=1 Tax=Actinoplanes sp. NPDC051494 TaxID=3363907 RepID=UPI00378F37C5